MTLTAESLYQKRYRLDRELGRPRNTDAAPAIAHIRALRNAGWSHGAIADAAGMSVSGIHALIEGRHKMMRTPNARRILALTPDVMRNRDNPAGFVPAIGTRRRIRALLRMGWPHAELRARSGVYTAVTATQAGDWVAKATHDAIAATYNALAMTPGPSERARGRAAKSGYPPPLAWDDDSIDDPAALPNIGGEPADVDEIAIHRAISGGDVELGKAERIEVIRRLAGDGWPDSRIAEQLKVTTRTVLRYRTDNDIPSRWAAA